MYKKVILFALLTAGVCLLYSCKKDNVKSTKPNSELIIGKWLNTKIHTKVYTMGNVLVKDSTQNLQQGSADDSYIYDVYNKSGSGYEYYIAPDGADTTKYSYIVSKDSLKETLTEVPAPPFTVAILMLNSTNLQVENTYTSLPYYQWPSLDENTTYKFIQDIYYTKQ